MQIRPLGESPIYTDMVRRPSKPISFPAEPEKKGLPNAGTSLAESSPVQERSSSEPDLSKVEIKLKDMV